MKIIEEDGIKYEFTEVKKDGRVIGTIKSPYYSPEYLENLESLSSMGGEEEYTGDIDEETEIQQ